MAADTPLYNWLDTRQSGLLLHLSSLPSNTGIGNLGHAAYEVVDFLRDSGIKIWQMCPLGPTGYGDSPYQCFSAFAGNPYFIDLDPLLDAGILEHEDLSSLAPLPTDHVDYGELYHSFWPVLRSAFERFSATSADEIADYGSISEFRAKQAHWIEDYARFMAFKAKNDGKCWLDWVPADRNYEKASKKRLTKAVKLDVEAHIFFQYLFYSQLAQLRGYATDQGVDIMGDLPIFVALDSADAWANQELFQLDSKGRPTKVAGVPPDYFSADGQLWGNPLFDWDAHRASDYKWWLQRIESTLEIFDIVRIDHFRGFESFWSVPASESTARNGEWVEVPGLELFTKISQELPGAKIVAEDLGVITDAVKELLDKTGLPGMAVLQFAFSGEDDNAYLPHNVVSNSIVYSGTHDNDTTRGWYDSLEEWQKDIVRRYLSVSGEDIAWDLIRAAMRSSANMAIVPLQDLLSLGSEARLNQPGSSMGNWQWRFEDRHLEDLKERTGHVRELIGETDRLVK